MRKKKGVAVERRWLRELIGRLKPALREAAGLSLFINLLALSVPVFSLQVYDRVVFYAGLSTLAALVLGMLLVMAFDLVIRHARSQQLQRIGLVVDVEIGRCLFEKFLSAPLRELEKRSSGYWLSLFRDVDVIRNGLSGSTFVLVTDLPFALLFLALVALIAWPVAWILFLSLPVFGALAWRSASVVGKRQADERDTVFDRDRFLSEAIAGRTTIKTAVLDDRFREDWERLHAATIRRALDRGRRADHFLHLSTVLGTALRVAITAVGAVAILRQEMTIGSLIAANILSIKVVGPLTQLVANWRGYTALLLAVDRVGQALTLPEERKAATVEPERPRGRIAAEDVRFSYGPGSAPAVDGISLALEPGVIHGVLGDNGSGKSTLLRLLCGLYAPDDGRVLLDGGDVAQFTRKQLASWIGYVPQETFLLDATIRENIVGARAAVEDEELIRVSTRVGLHPYVLDLPDGYGTRVGEGGRRLSGGMRQRVALARALMGDPPVLLLDEPSSQLDHQGQAELRGLLSGLAADHTVVLVTHSPALLSLCGRLVVLQNGRVRSSGPARQVFPRLRARPRPASRRAEPA